MFAWLGQYVTKTVVTAIAILATAGAGYWFWKHPEDLRAIWMTIKYAIAWCGFVVLLPWATFFVTRWVVTLESNRATAMMLLGYVAVDAGVAFWLMGGVRGHGSLSWAVVFLGFLAAAVYNFKVCEYQAERLEEI